MTFRINGARVKAAARSHAVKQLRNLGVSFGDGAGSASFKGQTAFAVWKQDAFANSVYSYRINYPALPDNSLLNRREADLIAAYTLHELGHVAFTDNSGDRKGGLLFRLWNGIEDARIEHAVIASGKARGARSMFKKLMSKYTTTHLSEEFNPTSINCAPFTLALVCRAAYGDGNGFAKTLLARIPAPWHDWYAAAAAGVVALPLDRSGSAGVLVLAQSFLDSWLAVFPDALDKPAAEQQPEQREQLPEDSEQLSDGDEEQVGGSDDESDEGESDDFDLGESDGDSDDESDADDFEWGDGDGDSDDESGVDEQSLRDDVERSLEEADEKDDTLFDSGDDPDDGDEGGDGGDGEGGKFDPVEDDKYDDEKCLSPEPNVDDVFAKARERTKGAIDLPASAAPARTEMGKWESLRSIEAKAVKRTYNRLSKAALPALKSKLYRILKAPEICGWDGGSLGGRFDGKRAPRMFAGSERVFKRRWTSEGIDTAVSIVIDLSGSMARERIKAAVELAFTVAQACESARADVEVVGFQQHYGGDYGVITSTSGTALDGEFHAHDSNGATRAVLIVAKSFKQKLASVAHHFTHLKSITGGGTPDYTAVKGVCEQLSNLPHQRKVVIVITDGLGQREIGSGEWVSDLSKRSGGHYRYKWNMQKLSDASHELFGCDVIGFGIHCDRDQFADAYPIGSPVDLHSLHKSALKGVIKQLDARDHRRVA